MKRTVFLLAMLLSLMLASSCAPDKKHRENDDVHGFGYKAPINTFSAG